MNSTALKRRFTAASIAALIALAGPAARAEDVDIFTAGAGAAAPKANVLIILDSSSNWSATLGPNSCNSGNTATNTKFAAEVCALQKIVPSLSGVRLGVMMFTESGNNGAYVRYAIRDMSVSNNRDALVNMVTNWVQQGSGTDNSGSNQPYAKAMYEAFKYFGGYTSPAHATDDVMSTPVDQTHFGGAGPQDGTSIAFAGGPDNNSGSYRRDYAGNNSGSATNATANRAADKYGADANNAFLGGASDNTYNSPIIDNCAKNFIIFISNGNPSTGGDSSTNPARDTALLANIGATTLAIPSAATETHPSKMDEFALYLNQTDVSARPGQQKVLTYTVAVYQPQSITYAADNQTVLSETVSNTDQQMINLMKSAATAGGGKYFAGRRADDVANALLQILNEVQAVNSVFVSASLPVSVNNQGTFLNQVYMGMFRPDSSGAPRWLGNVKEYQFILDATTGQLFLGDSAGNRAVNPATGFLSPSAVSFWTKRGLDPTQAGWPNRDFWIRSQSGTPPSGSDSPDGEVVEKGGAGEMQRLDYATSQGTRNVLTCVPSCSPNAAPGKFDNSTVTSGYQTQFKATSATELSLLVDWIRGQDNTYGQGSGVPGTAPCPVGSTTCTTWDSGENGPGWPATVRPSVHGDVLHSRPVVLNYTSISGCSANGCPYVFYGANDGTLRAIKGGTDGHEKWAFVAPEFFGRFKRLRDDSPELRTPGTPTDLIASTLPKDYFFDGPIGAWEDPNGTTKWIFVTARRGGALIYAFDVSDPENPVFKWKKTQADLPNLGQTWSLPWAFKLDGDTDPTLIFGAGYDTGEDSTPAVNNGVGRGIYVLNANDGTYKAFINTTADGQAIQSPVPSDMALLTSNSQVYRAYVGDTGGNVWRLDIPGNDVRTWKLFKFAQLGSDKKFFYAPDLVHAGGIDVVLLGSGDREKPLVTTSTDAFYGLYDQLPALGAAASVTTITTGSLQALSGTSGAANCTVPACLGWYRTLALGEKVVNSPLTVAGVTYFATNKPTPPAPGVCTSNLGEAKSYGVNFNNGGAPQNKTTISTTLTGGGLPPSPVGGVVQLNDGQLVTFVIGAGDSGSAIETGRVTLTIPKTRRKVYWNTQTDT